MSNKYFFSFVGIKFLGSFLVLLSEISYFYFLLACVRKFFLDKGFYFFVEEYNFFSINEGFNFFGWKFFDLKSDFFLGHVSLDNIKRHKLNLKNIVKSSLFCNSFYLIDILNKNIFIWLLDYSFSDSFKLYISGLDIFLYKILWAYVKRIHPRRPNTWIYNKYWKYYNYIWLFSIYDLNKAGVLFLKLHSFYNLKNYNNFSNFFSIFNYLNQKRLNYVVYRCFNLNFNFVYLYLWKRQSGLCFFCKRLLDYYSSYNYNLKIISNISSGRFKYLRTFSNLVLVHNICS